MWILWTMKDLKRFGERDSMYVDPMNDEGFGERDSMNVDPMNNEWFGDLEREMT